MNTRLTQDTKEAYEFLWGKMPLEYVRVREKEILGKDLHIQEVCSMVLCSVWHNVHW